MRGLVGQDQACRRAIDLRCRALIQQGICPTCQQFKTGNVYPGQADKIYYEDEHAICLLETYPRGSGHTIIISKVHYADSAEMPVALGCHLIRIAHALVNALKHVVEAEKVYMVTMCSGALSHLHVQLIPRRQGELMGGRVFASERGVLTNYHEACDALAEKVRRVLREST